MNIHPNLDLEPGQSLPRDAAVARTGSLATATTGPAPTTDRASISDGDQTHLSPAALAAAAASGSSDVRTDKVAAVQQALASGSYAVSASDVADKLIDHLLQN